MARQEGLLRLNGTLEGITFYYLNGKPVARKAGGGFTRKAIKTSAAMVRVRETASEFGQCSRVKKVFKNALFPFFGKGRDADLHTRTLQLFLAIKDCDVVSERGKRTVAQGLLTAPGRKLLEDFVFTEMAVPYSRAAYDTSTHQLELDLLAQEALAFGSGATHLEVCFGVLVFDFEGLIATLYPSEVVRVAADAVGGSLTLAPTTPPTGEGMQFAVVSYRYVQEVNGAFYPLKDGKGFGVRVLEVVV